MKNHVLTALLYLTLLVLLAIVLTSCAASRHSNKFKQTADSTVQRHQVQTEKKETSLTLEQKKVLRTKDTVRSKSDSLRSAFSYHPGKKGPVQVKVESGKLRGVLNLDPEYGTGDFLIEKKPEELPVDSYREESQTATYRNTDSSAARLDERKHTQTTTKTKDTVVERSALWPWLLLLLLLVAAGIYLHRRLKAARSRL